MATNNKYNKDAFINIYDVWARKTPSYELHYENEVIKPLTDFGFGTNEVSDAKGKVLGAGYEVLIMAFFIGLYSNKHLPLDMSNKIKDLGQPIQYWGNLDSKKYRKAYPRLREYIFIALVAKVNDGIDWLALEQGKWTVNEAVAMLMDMMEEYINYGLSIIKDKMDSNSDYFLNKSAFLDIFQNLCRPELASNETEAENEAESLD